MAGSEPNPRQTLALLIGASVFPRLPELAQGKAFYNAAQDFLEYLTSSDGLGLPAGNVNWSLFDDSRSPSDQLQLLRDFLEKRSNHLKSKGTPVQDLILSYVGHGLFAGPDYCLAVHGTVKGSEGFTSIRVRDLASALRDQARFIRKFLIFDCCFSAQAYREFQSAPMTVARLKLLEELPQRGTTLLCSSSANDASLAPEGHPLTMFSESLMRVLQTGHPRLGPKLSLSELGDLVKLDIRETHKGSGVRPEVHSPDQGEGDIANLALFPNAAWAQQRSQEARTPEDTEARERYLAERSGREAQQQIPALAAEEQNDARKRSSEGRARGVTGPLTVISRALNPRIGERPHLAMPARRAQVWIWAVSSTAILCGALAGWLFFGPKRAAAPTPPRAAAELQPQTAASEPAQEKPAANSWPAAQPGEPANAPTASPAQKNKAGPSQIEQRPVVPAASHGTSKVVSAPSARTASQHVDAKKQQSKAPATLRRTPARAQTKVGADQQAQRTAAEKSNSTPTANSVSAFRRHFGSTANSSPPQTANISPSQTEQRPVVPVASSTASNIAPGSSAGTASQHANAAVQQAATPITLPQVPARAQTQVGADQQLQGPAAEKSNSTPTANSVSAFSRVFALQGISNPALTTKAAPSQIAQKPNAAATTTHKISLRSITEIGDVGQSKFWVFRVTINGKEEKIGTGFLNGKSRIKDLNPLAAGPMEFDSNSDKLSVVVSVDGDGHNRAIGAEFSIDVKQTPHFSVHATAKKGEVVFTFSIDP
jgi:hypothetical protein